MSTKDSNINNLVNLKSGCGKGLKIGIVKAEWNSDITNALHKGTIEILKKYEAEFATIDVPGSVELVYGAKKMMMTGTFDAVIVLGCVIQGDTKHFDYVCLSVTEGITALNLQGNVPVIFGVLTVNDKQQALDRAGGKHGNKGEECAMSAIKMAKINKNIWNKME